MVDWLDLIYRADATSKEPVKYYAPKHGLLIHNLMENYQTESLSLAWGQFMKARWDFGFFQEDEDDCFEVFLWACQRKDLDWARRALREFQHRVITSGHSGLRELTPWAMSDDTANLIGSANFRRLLKACDANRLGEADALCEECAGYYLLENCRECECGIVTVSNGCDWPKVADDFKFT